MPAVSNENVGVAFGAVFAAGASTAVGAAIVFFPRLVQLASRRVLASSLGISAGVMTYVSFIEIFQKAVGSFNDELKDQIEDDDKRFGRANLYATLSFFLGIAIMIIIDVVVKKISNDDHHDRHALVGEDESAVNNQEVVVPPCPSCNPDPAKDLQEWQENAEKEEIRERNKDGKTLFTDDAEEKSDVSNDSETPPKVTIANVEDIESERQELENKKLVRMGFQTAVAIALHNFPEGLATFVAVLEDPKIGAILACAIGIHNIPEGFCVALPIYYATGNRLKAFMWGALSGASEPIGAFLGWLVLANSFSDAIYGLMFGLVAGMMVMISLKELLPTAYRYDPADTVVTNSLIAGMVVISLSLVLYYL